MISNSETGYLAASALLNGCGLPCEQALVNIRAALYDNSICGNHVARPDQQVRSYGHGGGWNLNACRTHLSCILWRGHLQRPCCYHIAPRYHQHDVDILHLEMASGKAGNENSCRYITGSALST